MNRMKLRSCSLLLCIALSLAGCGGDSQGNGAGAAAGGSNNGDGSIKEDGTAGNTGGGSGEGGEGQYSAGNPAEGRGPEGSAQAGILDNPAYSPQGRQVLTVVVTAPFREDLDRIVEYNATNPDYFVEMVNYGGGVESFENLDTQLPLEVLSGKGPDLVLWGSLNYSPSLASERLMEDLNEFMEGDPDFHREDYYENILEAFEMNGGLYVFPVSFSVNTGCVWAEELGTDRGLTESWTLEEMMEAYEDRTLAAMFAHNFTREFQLQFICEDCMGNFVDWSSGECRFDSPEFARLLEWCKTFPEAFQDDDYYEGMNHLEALKKGKIFWQPCSATPLKIAYIRIQNGDAALLWPGHPVPDGERELGGGVAQPGSVSFSICRNSGNQEAAWEFIKSWLTEDIQRELPEIPVLRSVSEERIRESMTVEYETVDGVKQEKAKYEIDTVLAELPGGVVQMETTSVYYTTQEDVDTFRSIIENTHRSYGRNAGVLDIIMEEAGAYFEGDKDAADVADIIQNRVSMYVSERML